MSRRFHTRPGHQFTAADWPKSWALRGPQPLTAEQLKRHNDIQAFRLVLARKEPAT